MCHNFPFYFFAVYIQSISLEQTAERGARWGRFKNVEFYRNRLNRRIVALVNWSKWNYYHFFFGRPTLFSFFFSFFFQGNTPEHWQQTAELCHACNFPILFYHTSAAAYIHSSIQPKLAHSRILLGGQKIKVNTRANAHKRNTQRIIGKKAHTKFAFWPEKQERKKRVERMKLF